MRKVISLLLIIVMSLSLLAGCAMGIGDSSTSPQKQDDPIPPTTETPIQDPNYIGVLGLFYRTQSGIAVLLSKDIGPLVLHNNISEFDDIMDFAIIKAETEVIMESYPAQTTIKNWNVTNKATVIDDWRDMVDEMTQMGYAPVESFYN